MYIIKGDERVNKILTAEAEAAIASLLRTVLTDAGYRCVWAPDGIQAADLLEQEPFDLALLDIMLPGADGYELLDYCKALDVPVIFLTALGEVEDRVRGLRRGAEDYLPKPFALSELLARVETVLRRCGKGEQLLRLEPDIEIDPAARIVRKGGQAVALTAKEFDLLELFMRNPGKVYTRENLLDIAWGFDYPGDVRTVDVHIRRLREKIEKNPAEPSYIKTKWGVGYYYKKD